MKILKAYALLFTAAAALLSGCATNNLTGRSQFMLVSEKTAIAQSESAYSSLVGGMDKSGKISKDVKLNERIDEITNRLITQAVRYRPDTSQWKWSVSVIDDPKTVNAFCMAGGKMAMYSGLITQLEPSDDEIAQVMGHEISHALANHQAEKMSVQLAANLAVAVVAVSGNNNNNQGRYDAASLAALTLVTLPNSRDQEAEADRLGIELAARAGYLPHAAVTLWEKMMKASGQSSRFDLLSTHPASPKRLESLAALEEPMQPIYQEGKSHFDVQPKKWISANAIAAASMADKGASTLVQPTSLQQKSEPAQQKMAPQENFYNPEFEKFKAGKSALSCDSCAMKFYWKQNELKALYDRKNWRELALQTIGIGYRLDLSFYYLGAAAQNLEFSDAAKIYYAEAQKLAGSSEQSCSGSKFIKCFDIDIGRSLSLNP